MTKLIISILQLYKKSRRRSDSLQKKMEELHNKSPEVRRFVAYQNIEKRYHEAASSNAVQLAMHLDQAYNDGKLDGESVVRDIRSVMNQAYMMNREKLGNAIMSVLDSTSIGT